MARGDPKRVRTVVRHQGEHIGYVTTVGYPDRDIAAFAGGTPYFEVTVSDLHERHVALLQRFKAHWLIHCGTSYGTIDTGRELTEAQITELAVFGLQHRGHTGAALVAALRTLMERQLEPPGETP